jgi:hypothetical protein
MTSKLKFIALIVLSFAFSVGKSFAQVAKEKQYYIEIKNVQTKAAAEQVELLIKAKPTVTFFTGFKIPVAFHLLKSTKAITKTEFENWLKPLGYQLVVFEEKELTASFINAKKRGSSKSEKQDKPTTKLITPKF